MSKKLKVKILSGCEIYFEDYCYKSGIFYKKYPEPIKYTYRVHCEPQELKAIYKYIKSIEDMPMIELSESEGEK